MPELLLLIYSCTGIFILSKCFVITVPGVCFAVTGGMHVARALHVRKGLGAGWRKPGPLAAAALVAMEDAAERFQKDHWHAKTFAKGCALFVNFLNLYLSCCCYLF